MHSIILRVDDNFWARGKSSGFTWRQIVENGLHWAETEGRKALGRGSWAAGGQQQINSMNETWKDRQNRPDMGIVGKNAGHDSGHEAAGQTAPQPPAPRDDLPY